MAKVKITNKELPFLNRDLEIDEAVLKELIVIQDKYKDVFKDKIKLAHLESLKRYQEKIECLKKAKASRVEEYDEEIKKYQELVNGLKKVAKPTKPKK